MSATRIRAADKLAAEVVDYVTGTADRDLLRRPETWESVAPADRAMMMAIGAFERGEMSYAELEEEGVRYVGAWEGVVEVTREEAA